MTSPKVTFYNFEPEIITKLLLNKDYKTCWEYITELIESFSRRKNPTLNDAVHNIINESDFFKEYLEKFSALIGELLLALLSNSSVKIPDQSFFKLMWNHELIHNLLQVQGIHETDSIVKEIIIGKKKLSPIEQKRMLILLSLNTNMDIVKLLKKTNAQYRCAALASYLHYTQAYKENIHANKIRLIDEMGHFLTNLTLQEKNKDDIVAILLTNYFSCSYLFHDKKHEIKKHVNDVIMRLMKKQLSKYIKHIPNNKNALVTPVESHKNQKPKLLVILEIYGPNHAMKRCYDNWLKSYKNVFDVTLCVAREMVYPELEENYNILSYHTSEEFLDILYSHQADMILFPSIGMTFWGIFASNLRIAPVQIMFLGHPATTKSPHIDFVYGPEEVYDKRAFPTDRFVAGRTRYKFDNILSKEKILNIDVQSYNPAHPRPIRASIVGTSMKITYPFLRMLKEIEIQSDFEIEFTFHLNSTGIDAHIFREHLKKIFKNITLYGFQEYDKFLESIGKTDIVLNPFPFGHTNTIIDTLLMGKPCISYFGIEPASRTERYVLSLVNMVEKFEVKTQDEYIQKFQDITSNIMQGHTDFYDRSTIYDILINYNDSGNNPAKELKWLYEHAREMKASKETFFKIS